MSKDELRVLSNLVGVLVYNGCHRILWTRRTTTLRG